MAQQKKVAIFDIDGTIFRSSLLIELVDALIADGIFPPRAQKMYEKAHSDWLDRKADYEQYISAVVRAFMKHIRGVSYTDFVRVSRKVIAIHRSRTYRYTRNLVRRLQRQGYYLLAISNSPKEILDEFCKDLGFDKVYGRMYEFDKDGKLKGNVLFLDTIENKARVLKRAIIKENLTLTKSIGVGDTEADIAFLSLVATPICFNPNKKLYRHAKRLGWKIVVERKDMIYEL